MRPTSHVNKLKLHANVTLMLVRASNDKGQPFFMYIKADQKGVDAIHRWYESGGKEDFLEFGEIIRHGWGIEPPDTVKKEMEKKYNFTH